jgi:hypothetical protein
MLCINSEKPLRIAGLMAAMDPDSSRIMRL